MADNTNGIDHILTRWRDEIKLKQRRIISFEETVQIKVKSLKQLIFTDQVPLNGWEFRQFQYTRKRERIFSDETWQPIAVGESWGGADISAQFRCNATMPAHFAGKKVVLKLYFGGDGLLIINGEPYFGLDPFRDTVYLSDCATGKEQYQLAVESYIFWHFGESELKNFESSYFAIMDQEMNDIYWDFQAAYNVMVMPEPDSDLLSFLQAGMAEAIQCIDQNESDPLIARENARQAGKILRERIYNSKKFAKDGLMHLCGNSHLDIVFLWTHAEFVRKLGRTHASTLRLMEQYPDYIFSQSQPLMYKEMKENYPSMYEEVKARVKEGRWEVIGASWVEPDCNLISGESFTRQFLYGIQFIEREFGVTPHTCWCPDVFGNCWSMPQILARCGLKYFVTHKMVVWNDTNPWRKNSFWWQGPDGTRILSLVPPTHFIGTIEPDHMAKHWENFSDKKSIGESLYNFGWGDGGGGPDAEMLEYQRRYADFPGIVPARPITIEGALDSIAAKAATADLPIINDELYLEEHRGVHTTKARLKKLNRRCEFLFRRLEMLCCLSNLPYPREEITSGWQAVLTNQFHDSLPGSHIPPVYQDLLDSYQQTMANAEALSEQALQSLTNRINTGGQGQAVLVFNSLAETRDTIAYVKYPESKVHVLDEDGNQMPSQFITHFESGERLLAFAANNLPQVGYAIYRIVPGTGLPLAETVKVTPNVLENEFLRLELNDEAQIVSLYDKTFERECIDPDLKGNVLKLYEDVPGKYEAWDIAPSYTDVEFDISGATVEVVEEGPLRSALLVHRNFRNSRMTQRIVLTSEGTRVDFENWVDWHEQQKMLKVRFNTNITTRNASYDIPYGNIERSCYRNNSFDEAKFEVPAHQWMDLSQEDYGLSLLNDCKYGHEAFGKMMALTLLRGPLNPDPTSDQEEHYFTWSLYPHRNGWREAGTVFEALDLNEPVLTLLVDNHEGELPAAYSFLTIEATYGVTLEALKMAEESEQLVVRIVERDGASHEVLLHFSNHIHQAVECNLLEREETTVDLQGNSLLIQLEPYQIRTFKIDGGVNLNFKAKKATEK